jgi:WD40 repeat protein
VRIYSSGDYIIQRSECRLSWYSLSKNQVVKVEEFTDTNEELILAASVMSPVLYVAETLETTYNVWEFDCTLTTENTKKKLYNREMGIEMDNCGDGVAELTLNESENGRVLHVFLCGSDESEIHVFDLIRQKMIISRLYHYEKYASIGFNPNNNFLAIKTEAGT